MKRFGAICICLVALGVALAICMDQAPADARKPAPPRPGAAPSAAPHPAAPPVTASGDAPPPAPGQIPDSAQLQQLLEDLAARKAEYERVRQDALRQRAEWKQRWAAETAAFEATAAQIAATEQTIAADRQALKETEARLQETITAARAEAEREQRERAEQAAAPPPAPQQASDF